MYIGLITMKFTVCFCLLQFKKFSCPKQNKNTARNLKSSLKHMKNDTRLELRNINRKKFLETTSDKTNVLYLATVAISFLLVS